MKKIVSVLLCVCLVCCFAAAAFADEPVHVYRKGAFLVPLPEGDWYELERSPGTTSFFDNAEGMMDERMLLFMQEKMDDDLPFSDSMLDLLYDSIFSGMSGSENVSEAESEPSEVAGHYARKFSYKLQMGTTVYQMTGNIVCIDRHVLIFDLTDTSMNQEELNAAVDEMSRNMVFDPDGNFDAGQE